jgi:hypothetical protein
LSKEPSLEGEEEHDLDDPYESVNEALTTDTALTDGTTMQSRRKKMDDIEPIE